MYLKVKDFPGLVRDSKSKAIINVDKNAYNEHMQKKLVKEKMSNMNNEINNIKQTVDEIKDLLIKLADK